MSPIMTQLPPIMLNLALKEHVKTLLKKHKNPKTDINVRYIKMYTIVRSSYV